jgi:hypothetical protein
VTDELRGLSRGEIAFLVPVGVVVVAIAFVAPGGAAAALFSALFVGLLAGAVIAVKRRWRPPPAR